MADNFADILNDPEDDVLRSKYYDMLSTGLSKPNIEPNGMNLAIQGGLPALAAIILGGKEGFAASAEPLTKVYEQESTRAQNQAKFDMDLNLKKAGIVGEEIGRREKQKIDAFEKNRAWEVKQQEIEEKRTGRREAAEQKEADRAQREREYLRDNKRDAIRDESLNEWRLQSLTEREQQFERELAFREREHMDRMDQARRDGTSKEEQRRMDEDYRKWEMDFKERDSLRRAGRTSSVGKTPEERAADQTFAEKRDKRADKEDIRQEQEYRDKKLKDISSQFEKRDKVLKFGEKKAALDGIKVALAQGTSIGDSAAIFRQATALQPDGRLSDKDVDRAVDKSLSSQVKAFNNWLHSDQKSTMPKVTREAIEAFTKASEQKLAESFYKVQDEMRNRFKGQKGSLLSDDEIENEIADWGMGYGFAPKIEVKDLSKEERDAKAAAALLRKQSAPKIIPDAAIGSLK